MGEAISKAVLITGCSTGIGRATAERLAQGGWRVNASSGARSKASVLALSLLALAACERQSAKAPQPTPVAATTTPSTPEGPRLPIDAQTSPVEFQWLANDAVLVEPEVPKRELAEFGNYLSRAAKTATDAEISVYTDAEAWQQDQAEPATRVAKRAEYEKHSSPEALERYAVYDPDGKVIYERDFRNYPLSESD